MSETTLDADGILIPPKSAAAGRALPMNIWPTMRIARRVVFRFPNVNIFLRLEANGESKRVRQSEREMSSFREMHTRASASYRRYTPQKAQRREAGASPR